MTELFDDISQEMKEMITSYIDMAFIAIEPLKIPQLINDFVNTMPTDNTKNFADFYFRLKIEELRNGDNYNQREE